MAPSSKDLQLETIMQMDEECGFGGCRPKYLQLFASIQWFVGVYSISALLSSTMSSFVNSQVPMLEKQFGFSSGESGLLMSCNDIGFLTSAVFFGYIARKVHIPRGLGVATLMYGASGMLCAMPYFIQDHSKYDLDHATSSMKLNVTYTSRKNQIPMCTLGHDNPLSDWLNASYSHSDIGSDQVTDDDEHETTKKVAFTLIAMGMVLQGLAKSARAPFTTIYVDDGADKQKTGFYFGMIMGTAIFGPALAYFLGGYFSKIYVTLKEVEISPRDPRWIGAWWLGFVVFGTCSIIVSIPLFCFPRRLRNKRHTEINGPEKQENERMTSVTSTPKTSFNTLIHEAKVFLSSVLRVLRNPVFSITTASGCIGSVALAGILSFLSKYISSQYSIPLWQANMLMAACSILAYSIGSFVGGFISRRFRMTPQNCFLILIIFSVICQILSAGGLLVGCDQPELIKDILPSTPRDGINTSLTETCSSDCTCTDGMYFPICGAQGRTYYSPCHAGCTEQVGMELSNCTCISGGKARSGLCDQGCSRNLYIFAALTFASALAEAFKIVPSILINIRCVETRDRAVATAVSGFLYASIGWMPGPVIFGQIVDGGCTLWRYTGGVRQDCLIYDLGHFRRALHANDEFDEIIRKEGKRGRVSLPNEVPKGVRYGLGLKIIPLLLVIGIYVYFRLKNVTTWRQHDVDAQSTKVELNESHNDVHEKTRIA